MVNAVAGVVRNDEVRAAWRAIAEPGLVYEIRALEATTRDDRYPREWSGYFNDVEAVAKALATVTSAVGVYVTMNPVKPDLRARADNRLKAAKKGMATADAHVVRRRFLLLDVDPRRESNISSTDDEHESAIELATLISKELGEEGWPEPVLADSGNGAHLLYRVDLPADDGGIVERAVKVLAKRFSDDALEVDTSVFNASRIVRLYGTKACKGDDTPDLGRVHRFSLLKLVPDPLVAVPSELLQKVGAPLLAARPAAQAPPPRAAVHRNGGGGRPDAIERCGKYVGNVHAISGQGGHKATLQVACECYRFGLSDADAWEVMAGWNVTNTGGEPWADAELRHKLDDAKKKVTHDGEIGIRLRSDAHRGSNGNGQHASPNGNGRLPPRAHLPREGPAPAAPAPVTASAAANVDADQGWGEPLPLEPKSALARVAGGIFVGTFGNYAHAVAEHTETPFEFAALIGLSCCAAMVQGRISLLVEPNYFEPLNAWLLPAMESGGRKTAVVKRMKAPLVGWDQEKRKEFEPVIKKVKSQIETKLAYVKKLREEASKKKEIGYELAADEIAKLEAEIPDLPNVPRLLMGDVTPEHTATIMSKNGERIAMIDSECGSMIGQFQGRYSKNGVRNLDIYLNGYDGSSVHVERRSAPDVHLLHPLLSIGVSPQPGALAALVADTEFRDRGLLARFLYAKCDARLGYRPLKSRPIPAAVEQAYTELMIGLAELRLNYVPDEDGAEGEVKQVPYVMRLSAGAHEEWKQFQRAVELDMREGSRLERLRDWAGKLPGNVARVAGLLHCLDCGAGVVDLLEVPRDTMARAVTLGEFFVQHATATFDFEGVDQVLDLARELWKYVQRGRWSPFTARDAWELYRARKGMSMMRNFQPVLDLLVEHNLIARTHAVAKNKKGGRPSVTFEVHPQFADDWQ